MEEVLERPFLTFFTTRRCLFEGTKVTSLTLYIEHTPQISVALSLALMFVSPDKAPIQVIRPPCKPRRRSQRLFDQT